MVRRIAAFAGILIGTAVAVRVAASLLRGLMSILFLGWVDRIAGALAGAAIGLVVLGTALYLLNGADIEPLREPLRNSTLAPQISQVSLVSTSIPWCSELVNALGVARAVGAGSEPSIIPSDEPAECANLMSVAESLLGSSISDKLSGFLGKDVVKLADVVQTGLTGSLEEITDLAREEFGNK